MNVPFIVVIAVFAMMLVVVRYACKCKLGEIWIEVVAFGVFPLLRIPFANIAEIRRVSLWESLRLGLCSQRLGNRLWNIVLVRTREGVIRNVLITPDKPDDFVDQVRERLGQSRLEPNTDQVQSPASRNRLGG